jgi:hypothetical protein
VETGTVQHTITRITSIFVFVREYSSSETQETSPWKYLYERSPTYRVVANLEEGFPGFHVLPIKKYIG